MSELTIMKDDSVENLEDPNRLRISKPSFQNVKRNISSIATQGIITLNKVRDIIPKLPYEDQVIKGTDWAYKSSLIGKYDEAISHASEQTAKFIGKQDFPHSKTIGAAAGLGIALASPDPMRKVKGIINLNKLRKVTTPNRTNLNIFPPNQTLQPQFATVGPNNLRIKPTNVADDLTKPVLKINKTTGSNILEQLYPGNRKPQRLIKEKLSSDSGPAKEYRELLEKYAEINKDIPLTTVGNKRVKITTVKKDLFEKDVKRLVELKKELKLPNQNKFNQELGAFMDESGELYRLGSKGDFKPEGYANVQKRLANQGLIPVTEQFDPLKPKWGAFTNRIRQKITTKLGLQKPEKDT